MDFLNSLFTFKFLLKKQQNSEDFVHLGSLRLGACCLTILIYMFKECLRVRCDHATPTFPDFKVIVYGVKGDSLWG